MQILHLIASEARRGAEVAAWDLSGALARRGHRSHIAALSRSTTSRHALPVEILGTSAFSPASLRWIRKKATSADVVVAHGSRTLPASVIALTGTGTPLVYRSIGDSTVWARTRAQRMRLKLALNRCTAVVYLWPGARDALALQYGVPPDRLVLIANAISEEFIAPTAGEIATAKKHFGVPGGAGVVAFVGSLSDEKRPMAVVEIARRLPKYRFLIAGEGPLRQDIERAALPNVRVLGDVNAARKVYLASDVLVVPSTTEGTPAVVLEAAACRLPTVASSVGGLPSIIEDGRTGYLCPVDDLSCFVRALGKAAGDKVRLGIAAAERVDAHHRLLSTVDAWEDLLCKVVKTHETPRRINTAAGRDQ